MLVHKCFAIFSNFKPSLLFILSKGPPKAIERKQSRPSCYYSFEDNATIMRSELSTEPKPSSE